MSDTQKKKRTVYSFGLKKTDSPIIKEFIENHTNFSETVRYLIYKYVSENNTADISYKFNELLFNNAMTVNTNKSINEDNVIESENHDTSYNEESNNIIDTNDTNDTENNNTLEADDIPDCYK